MKLKMVIMAFFMLLFWNPKTIFAQSPPVPAVHFPFDVSRSDTTLNQEFQIRDARSYVFAIKFNYFGHADLYRVLALVGDGSAQYLGLRIPIHLKILKLDAGSLPPELIYEDTMSTKEHYAHGFERDQKNGSYDREIVTIDLQPGIYRVVANTIKDSQEFSGTPSQLLIEFHPNIKFLPKSKRGAF
ncbi:MAG: DUF5625 family protein [Deltaproteobacteria bacterium]|nr:DUF5625 family protein [Deltaproteobacteria bacterium]